MLLKCCTQYASKFGKLSSGHWTGKGQFSFQSQRKAMPKNAQTTAQLHSSHASKVMLKILQARPQQYVNRELPDVQARETGTAGRHSQRGVPRAGATRPRTRRSTVWAATARNIATPAAPPDAPKGPAITGAKPAGRASAPNQPASAAAAAETRPANWARASTPGRARAAPATPKPASIPASHPTRGAA